MEIDINAIKPMLAHIISDLDPGHSFVIYDNGLIRVSAGANKKGNYLEVCDGNGNGRSEVFRGLEKAMQIFENMVEEDYE